MTAVDRRNRTIEADGRRRYVHPTEARGVWANRKEFVQVGLIVFFLVLPWIRIGGRPMLLLDIAERKFSIFGLLFRAHDVPIVFLVAIGFILFFGWLTALFGRVWCGWACPQTVFIEAAYRRIERYFEGAAEVRRAREGRPMDADLFLRRSGKWGAYLAVSLAITHSVLAVFLGTERLAGMIAAGPAASPTVFLVMAVSTLVILFDFGWFREQFCIVVCPYGRIQSVFQDSRTLTVAYDARRGEPRGRLRRQPEASGPYPGDCVDCSRCVRVCPTGIDIRNGSSQLECIACTACIDACDDVMGRLGRARGLIRYASVEELEADRDAAVKPTGPFGGLRAFLRPRALAYAGLLLATGLAVIGIAGSRGIASIEIFKLRGDPFATVAVPDGAEARYANTFFAEIASRTDGEVELRFALGDAAAAGVELVMPNNPLRIPAGEIARQPLTLTFGRGRLVDGKARVPLRIELRRKDGGAMTTEERSVTLVGPF